MAKITEIAARKFKEVLKKENKENWFLRIYLVGVGCGGQEFGMTLEESKTDDDILDEEYGVSLITDKKHTSQFEGAIVDFVEAAYGGGFVIRTANSDSGVCGDSCGCGGGCGGSC